MGSRGVVADDRHVRGARNQQPDAAAAASAFPVRRWLEARRTVLALGRGDVRRTLRSRPHELGTDDVLDLLYAVPLTLCALELGLLGRSRGGRAGADAGPRRGARRAAHMSVAGTARRGLAFLVIGGVAGTVWRTDARRPPAPVPSALLGPDAGPSRCRRRSAGDARRAGAGARLVTGRAS